MTKMNTFKSFQNLHVCLTWHEK